MFLAGAWFLSLLTMLDWLQATSAHFLHLPRCILRHALEFTFRPYFRSQLYSFQPGFPLFGELRLNERWLFVYLEHQLSHWCGYPLRQQQVR